MWSWIALPLYFAPVFYLLYALRRSRRELAAEEAAGLTPGVKGWLALVAFLLLGAAVLSALAAVLSLAEATTPLARAYPAVMALEALVALLGALLGLNALLALHRHQRRFRGAVLALVLVDLTTSLAFPLLAWGVIHLFSPARPTLAGIMALGEVMEDLSGMLASCALDLALLAYVRHSRRVAITCLR